MRFFKELFPLEALKTAKKNQKEREGAEYLHIMVQIRLSLTLTITDQ